jgi:hypothetical protein
VYDLDFIIEARLFDVHRKSEVTILQNKGDFSGKASQAAMRHLFLKGHSVLKNVR